MTSRILKVRRTERLPDDSFNSLREPFRKRYARSLDAFSPELGMPIPAAAIATMQTGLYDRSPRNSYLVEKNTCRIESSIALFLSFS